MPDSMFDCSCSDDICIYRIMWTKPIYSIQICIGAEFGMNGRFVH